LNSLGGIAIDGEGNMMADDNFMAGATVHHLGDPSAAESIGSHRTADRSRR